MAQKPSIPKGTRDFGAVETARRNYIFDTIREAFRLFGFSQIETPAMENLSTLMGKYGDEGDKLLFKVLNSGDFLKGIDGADIEKGATAKLASQLCEKGLRYDLTVPFARYVVQHRNELQMPFRRFQMQPVWRADRPQKGRYREFYQCDADVVGSESLCNEAELMSLIDFVMSRLGIRVNIKVNNRKILTGIAEVINAPEKIVPITVAIDKIDKIGIDNVVAELMENGLDYNAISTLRPLLQLQGSTQEKLSKLKEMLQNSETGLKGIDEMQTVLKLFSVSDHKCEVEFDPSLARGLNYYTGTILEVKALDTQIGSISGGGRYDNLTGVFGMPGLSGVGISFGADRIYDVLTDLNLFPENIGSAPKVMFVNAGDKSEELGLNYLSKLRKRGVSGIIYPDAAKMKKQMAYANALKIPFVAFIGEEEFMQNKISLKDMTLGTQEMTTIDSILDKLA